MHSKRTARAFRLIRQDILQDHGGPASDGPYSLVPGGRRSAFIVCELRDDHQFPIGHGSILKNDLSTWAISETSIPATLTLSRYQFCVGRGVIAQILFCGGAEIVCQSWKVDRPLFQGLRQVRRGSEKSKKALH